VVLSDGGYFLYII